MTEIEKLLVEVANALTHLNGGSVEGAMVKVSGTIPEPLWDKVFMVVSQLENKEYKPEEATPTVEQRLEALERRLDCLPDAAREAVHDIDLDSYVDTYLRDRGVERYMDPVALRNEIAAVFVDLMTGAAASAGRSKDWLSGFPRRIGGAR